MVSAIEIKPDQLKHASTQTMDDEPDSDETNYCNIVSQAYDKLYMFEFIRLDLLVNPSLVKMVDLREKLMIYMRSMGATEISESTKKKTFPKKAATCCNLKIS